MTASPCSLLATIFLILLFSLASTQSNYTGGTVPPLAVEGQLQSSAQANINDFPIHLHQVGQCPTSPKPVCSDPTCQGVIYVSPVQYQCVATTVFPLSDRDVTIVGCRCCPLPDLVWCPNHDCRALIGTRQCVSDELEGCACETTEDHWENYRRQLAEEDVFVLAEGEIQEDFIEIDDDENDVFPMSPIGSVMARSDIATTLSQTLQEQEGHRTSAMALQTLGIDEQHFNGARDAQVDVFASC